MEDNSSESYLEVSVRGALVRQPLSHEDYAFLKKLRIPVDGLDFYDPIPTEELIEWHYTESKSVTGYMRELYAFLDDHENKKQRAFAPQYADMLDTILYKQQNRLNKRSMRTLQHQIHWFRHVENPSAMVSLYPVRELCKSLCLKMEYTQSK
jgi:hypothetical protein